MYRQGVPGSGLSIEQATGDVPADGRYYVISGGVIHRGYRSLRDATATYERLRAAGREAAAVAEASVVAPGGAPGEAGSR